MGEDRSIDILSFIKNKTILIMNLVFIRLYCVMGKKSYKIYVHHPLEWASGNDIPQSTNNTLYKKTDIHIYNLSNILSLNFTH